MRYAIVSLLAKKTSVLSPTVAASRFHGIRRLQDNRRIRVGECRGEGWRKGGRKENHINFLPIQ